MKQFFTAFMIALSFGAVAQDQVTIALESPGTLPEVIGTERKMEIKSLTVTGDINGADIAFIREMGKGTMNYQTYQWISNLLILDLSGANIISGTDPYINSYPYPETVEGEIGRDMFSGFTALVELKLPDSVTVIRKNGINSCPNLAILTLPAELRTVEQWGLYYLGNVTELTIPSKTELIEELAFTGSGLETVTIESPVLEMQPGAFAGLSRLTSIEVGDGNPSFSSIEGVLFSKDGTVLALYPGGREDSKYDVPENVTELGDYAFYGNTSISEVSLPEGLVRIGNFAFDGCTSLGNVAFPTSLTEIGDYAFLGSAMTEIKLENTQVETIGANSFLSVKCEILTLPNTLKSVGEWAFPSGNVTKLVLPASLEYIGEKGFCMTTLQDVYAEGKVPAECGGDDVFGQYTLASVLFQDRTAVLHVPEGTLKEYKNADGWSYFAHFVDDVVTDSGIGSMVDGSHGEPAYFNLSGQRVDTPQSGVYVVRYPDGTTGKILKR